jgi:hypothetical protein
MDKVWDIEKVEKELSNAFKENSERKILEILKKNSFLFYELYHRKFAICPCFSEVSLGNKYRCDFCWLNDNSDGPEWTLVEIEKPKMQLFTLKNEPTASLHHAVEQVNSWKIYFDENPLEKRRIFGAVSKFRFVLVVGDKESWSNEYAAKWRRDKNNSCNIEIRTYDVFNRALQYIKTDYESFWSFTDNPICLQSSELDDYWKKYDYISYWRKYI